MDNRTRRLEPLTGVLFGVLLVVGGLMTSRGAEDELSANALVRFFEGSETRILVGGTLLMLSAAMLVWFVACLRTRLMRDGDDDHHAAIVLTSGGAAAAIVLISAVAMLGAIERTDQPGSIEPAQAGVAWDLYSGLLGTALPVVLAVLVAATVLAARRSGWFSREVAWLSWVLVVGLLVPPAAWMFAAVAVLWIAAVSVSMTGQRPGVGAT